ncbi:hypothetical protein RJ55_04396 [Drechmeria coniospora]|nr:hypothetical protein RJ55_04396 [Drechmeria coniospora]
MMASFVDATQLRTPSQMPLQPRAAHPCAPTPSLNRALHDRGSPGWSPPPSLDMLVLGRRHGGSCIACTRYSGARRARQPDSHERHVLEPESEGPSNRPGVLATARGAAPNPRAVLFLSITKQARALIHAKPPANGREPSTHRRAATAIDGARCMRGRAGGLGRTAPATSLGLVGLPARLDPSQAFRLPACNLHVHEGPARQAGAKSRVK